MTLDSHGKLALVEVIIYVPIGLFCIYNNIRHGFRRDVGWIYLTIFSIIKIAGSIMTIQIENGTNTSMITTATILNTIALSPLLNASLCFLNVGLDKAHSFARHVTKALKLVHLLIIVGLILSITGGISRTKTAQDSLDAGARELQLASIVFAVVWVLVAIACLIYIKNLHYVQSAAKRLVLSVTMALPFLLVRIVYSALNAINLDTSSSHGHTMKFNPVLGSWRLNLALGLATEFVVVALYTITGIVNSIAKSRDEVFGYEGIEATL